MNVKIIKNKQDYSVAMSRLLELMSLNPSAGSNEENELELLSLVIEDFERKTVPPAVVDPIEFIRFRMDQMGLSRKDLVPYIGSTSRVSEVLSRKRPLSLAMIRRLHRGLDIPLEVLIAETGFEREDIETEATLDYGQFPLKEMHKRGLFPGFTGQVNQLKDSAEELIRSYFGDLAPQQPFSAFLRAPLHQNGHREIDEYALAVWRINVLRQARGFVLENTYKPGTVTLEWLRELVKLSSFNEGPKLAKEFLARHGIILVVEKHFNKTYLDGAAMLDNLQPIVALTLRHDRIDNFWFVLIHELAHVALHLSAEAPIILDDLESLNMQEQIEQEADEMASEALIPSQLWATAKVRNTLLLEDLLEFAREINVHPVIVAGRLRHETTNYTLFAKLISQVGRTSVLLTET